jgi:carboxypeptidase family protein
MRISRPALAALALILWGANANAQSETAAKPRATNQAAPENSRGPIVKGLVLYEDTGQPAPRQRVQLIAVESLADRRGSQRVPTTMTDAKGAFILARPAAGDYYVVAQPADEHAPSAASSPFPLQTGDPDADAARLDQYKRDFPRITVSGENPIEINLRVKNPHFGSISGSVINASGAAAVGATVHLMKTGEAGFGGSVITDEKGGYKFRGLPAGEYLVSADPPRKKTGSDSPQNVEGPRSVEGTLGATYFPSTIERRESPPITVLPDGDVGDINITLVPLNLHNVTGTVQAEGDGHPIAGATVRLNKKNADQTPASEDASGLEAAMSNYFSTTDAQGRWSLSNLPDGVYSISVRPTGLVGAKFERFVEKRQDLTIAGSDVENLAIEVSLGGRVSGRVTIEQLNARRPPDISIGVGSSITKVEASGAFTVTGAPDGEFPLSVMIRPQHVFYAKSIVVNGVDLLREKLQTKTGAEIKDVQIVVAPASVLTGRVLSASGRTPLGRISVMLIPVDSSTAPAFARPNGSTNGQGSFIVSGAPGEYFVVSWAQGESLPPRDPDSIKKLPNAIRVTLGPGERKSIELIK